MSQTIKVLHIIKSLGRGGAEMLLPETLKLHNQTQLEFHYIYFLPWKNQLVEDIEKNGGKITCLPAKNNLTILKQSKNIIKYIKKHQIDMIHAHLPWAGFVSRLVHRQTGIPVVYSEHNMQERYHFITKYLNKYTYNWQNLALGVSQDVSNSIQKNINPKIPVKTLLNGVNTERFQRNKESGKIIRKQFNIPENAVVIGNVAVFRFQKRLIEWLRVMKEVIDKNTNVYGILVGAGPLEKEIKNQLTKLNLKEKVLLTGLQTDVKPYFNAMDIFMMSSSFEGLPIALLEAMSMECAIVTTDAGGIKEVIRHEQDGLLCNVNDWKKLPDLLHNLIDDQKLLNLYQKNARKRVIDSFSLKSMVKQLEDVYLSLLN